jgi:hypothetical protein
MDARFWHHDDAGYEYSYVLPRFVSTSFPLSDTVTIRSIGLC